MCIPTIIRHYIAQLPLHTLLSDRQLLNENVGIGDVLCLMQLSFLAFAVSATGLSAVTIVGSYRHNNKAYFFIFHAAADSPRASFHADAYATSHIMLINLPPGHFPDKQREDSAGGLVCVAIFRIFN